MSVSPIIERVQKLLALSKGSSNANEAANAAGLANKLIDQYRLSIADLEASDVDCEPIEEDSEYIYESGRITAWKSNLVTALVKHYGCAVWNDVSFATGRKVSRYRMVGKRSDIGITRYMFSYLSLECERLAALEARGMGRIFAASYCIGFVYGVRTQLAASRLEAQKDATSSAIVKVDSRVAASNDAMNNMHRLKASKGYSSASINQNAYSMGKSKGQNLHLGASLNSGGTKALNK